MKRSEAFPSKYLSKDDVQPPIIAKIRSVTRQTVNSEHGEEDKTVIEFHGAVKPMICNNVNWGVIEDMYGGESDDWINKSITLYCDPNVMFGAKRTGGIRVQFEETLRSKEQVEYGTEEADILARAEAIRNKTAAATKDDDVPF